MLRKLERRYYLTTELLIKSGYGWLIGLGTKSAYETASLQTAVVMDKLPAGLGTTGFVHHVKVLPNGMVLTNLPRYAEFNTGLISWPNIVSVLLKLPGIKVLLCLLF